MLEDRIIELETRLAFQEDQLDQLNQAISSQQLQLNDTQDLIKVLLHRLNELSASVEDDNNVTQIEKPPHY